MAEYDEAEIGGMQFDGFIHLMTDKSKFKESHESVQKIFRKYDRKNKGFIEL